MVVHNYLPQLDLYSLPLSASLDPEPILCRAATPQHLKAIGCFGLYPMRGYIGQSHIA